MKIKYRNPTFIENGIFSIFEEIFDFFAFLNDFYFYE